jgi:hypothetical protein
MKEVVARLVIEVSCVANDFKGLRFEERRQKMAGVEARTAAVMADGDVDVAVMANEDTWSRQS